MKRPTSIGVSNFRGIKETVEPVPLDDITIIVGWNGAGKTSLLEALYTFVGGEDPLSGQPRINRVMNEHGGGTVAHKYTGDAEITVEIDGGKVVSHLSNKVDSITFDGEDQGELLRRSDIDSENSGDQNDIWNLYFSTDRPYTQEIKSLASYNDEIMGKGIHADVADFLSEFSTNNFTEVYLEHNQIRVDPPDNPPYLLDLNDLAHGLLKMVPAYIATEYFRPGYLIWDDIEAAFHPKFLTGVFEWLAELDTQAIVATHSMDTLLAALDVATDDITILQLGTDNDRSVKFEQYSKDELYTIIADSGHDPRFLPVGEE